MIAGLGSGNQQIADVVVRALRASGDAAGASAFSKQVEGAAKQATDTDPSHGQAHSAAAISFGQKLAAEMAGAWDKVGSAGRAATDKILAGFTAAAESQKTGEKQGLVAQTRMAQQPEQQRATGDSHATSFEQKSQPWLKTGASKIGARSAERPINASKRIGRRRDFVPAPDMRNGTNAIAERTVFKADRAATAAPATLPPQTRTPDDVAKSASEEKSVGILGETGSTEAKEREARITERLAGAKRQELDTWMQLGDTLRKVVALEGQRKGADVEPSPVSPSAGQNGAASGGGAQATAALQAVGARVDAGGEAMVAAIDALANALEKRDRSLRDSLRETAQRINAGALS